MESYKTAILPALDEVQTIVATFFAAGQGIDLLPLNLQRETPSRVSIRLREQ